MQIRFLKYLLLGLFISAAKEAYSAPEQQPRFSLSVDAYTNSQEELLSNAQQFLSQATDEFERILSLPSPKGASLRLVTREVFREVTRAPQHTGAMYKNGEIIVSISKQQTFDRRMFEQTIRHEYAHAFVASSSKGRCPPWLDEGLAQFFEGPEHPALSGALKDWIAKHPPMALSEISSNLLDADKFTAQAAYGHSLFALQTLINVYGAKAVGRYLNYLGNDSTPELAFEQAFGLTERAFEEKLSKQLLRWQSAHSGSLR